MLHIPRLNPYRTISRLRLAAIEVYAMADTLTQEERMVSEMAMFGDFCSSNLHDAVVALGRFNSRNGFMAGDALT